MQPDELVRIEEVIPDYVIRPGYYLKAGWELFKQNGLGFIGFSVVVLFVMLALGTKAGVGQIICLYYRAAAVGRVYHCRH